MTPIELPYPPSLNRYWRTFRGRHVVSAEARSYKADVAVLARQAGLHGVFLGPVVLVAVLHPKTRQRASTRPVRCIDLDNGLKVAVDALQGVAYANDSQLVGISIRRGEPVPGGALVVSVGAA
jgi:crossover junction endodeoxyribonuclease RusA